MIYINKYSNEIYSTYAYYEAVPDSRYWKSLPPPFGVVDFGENLAVVFGVEEGEAERHPYCFH